MERGTKFTHKKRFVTALRNMKFARVVYWFDLYLCRSDFYPPLNLRRLALCLQQILSAIRVLAVAKREAHGPNFIYVTTLAPPIPFATAIKTKKINLDILPPR